MPYGCVCTTFHASLYLPVDAIFHTKEWTCPIVPDQAFGTVASIAMMQTSTVKASWIGW